MHAQVHANSALCWLNSPDGATFSSGKAELIGTSHFAYARILGKCLQNPRMIASMSSAAWDGHFSGTPSFLKNNIDMAELMFPEIIDYFVEQYMDRASSTPGYANGKGVRPILLSAVGVEMDRMRFG